MRVSNNVAAAPKGQFDELRPRQDSNLRSRLRRPMLYPLSYEGLPSGAYPLWQRCLALSQPERSDVVDRRGRGCPIGSLSRHWRSRDPTSTSHRTRLGGGRRRPRRARGDRPGAAGQSRITATGRRTSHSQRRSRRGRIPRVLADDPRGAAWKTMAVDHVVLDRGRRSRLHQLPPRTRAGSTTSWSSVVERWQSTEFGVNELGAGRSVIVEFVSANPDRTLSTPGTRRGAVYGDALASLLEWSGYDGHARVLRQRSRRADADVRRLARGARKEGPRTARKAGYHGQYIVDWAAEMPDDADSLEWGYARALLDQKDVLETARSHGSTSGSASGHSSRTASSTTALEHASHERGMIFEDDEATWLRSSDFGDDKDRVYSSSRTDSSPISRRTSPITPTSSGRADELVNVWGADHHGYIARMKAAMAALGNDPEMLDVQITQMVQASCATAKRSNCPSVPATSSSSATSSTRSAPTPTRFTYLLQSIDSQFRRSTSRIAVVAGQGQPRVRDPIRTRSDPSGTSEGGRCW